MFQTPSIEYETCLVLDQESCVTYFAWDVLTDQLMMEEERLCPTVTRYDEHGTPLTDLIKYSPFFDLDLMATAHALASMASSIV